MFGRTEEACEKGRKDRREGDIKSPLSTTALSTIAVQCGQTQIVVSVLKSGSSVHLQLIHVEPGLCEIGSNQEDNQTLTYEQKQLLEKLQKHEDEVLSSVQKKREEQYKQRPGGWMGDERRTGEEEKEDGVYRAMETSLREGWILLLRLLDSRLHALTLAADFYRTVKEFVAGIEMLGDVEIEPDKFNRAQLTYTSVRRDLLGKSFQLLGISSDLLQKLRKLQKTEALQRQGHVLQEGEGEQESSQCSWGSVRRLEQMVEMLQERRRTMDNVVKLQIQQAQEQTQTRPHDQGGEEEDWSLSSAEVLAQKTPSLMEFDLELKLNNTKILSKLPQVLSNPTDTEEDYQFPSSSDLVSVPSNETLDRNSASKLSEEEELRVESRKEERESSPEDEFVGLQETMELHKIIKTEPASNIELDNALSSNDDLEIHCNLQADNAFTEEILSKQSVLINETYANNKKMQQSDKKMQLPSGFLPDLNLALLKRQPKLQETNYLIVSTNDSLAKAKFVQESENRNFNGESSSNCDLSTELTSKEFLAAESDNSVAMHTSLEANSESKLSDVGVHFEESSRNDLQDGELETNLESPKNTKSTIKQVSEENLTVNSSNRESLHERKFEIISNLEKKIESKFKNTTNSDPNQERQQDGEFQMNLKQKDPLSKIKVSKENLVSISDLNQELQTTLELRSRSLPIFNLVSKKLMPKLQETKDFLNISSDLMPISCQEKQKSNHYTTLENLQESKVVEEVEISETEDTTNLYMSTSLNDIADVQSDQETEVELDEKFAPKEILKSDISLTVNANDAKQDAQETRSENFCQRFQKLKTKWQEKDSNNSTNVPLKFELKKFEKSDITTESKWQEKDNASNHFTLVSKNMLPFGESQQWETTADIKCDVEDKKVMLLSPEEPMEEKCIHEIEMKPSLETIVKVKSTMFEKCELKLDHSTAERKQEEAEIILHREKIQKLEATFDQLAHKLRTWFYSCNREMIVSSHPGSCFSEAQHSVATYAQLQAQAKTASEDAESMKQVLAQMRSLCTDSPGSSSVDPKFSAQADFILKDLSTVTTTIQSNLQLLQPYVMFLQTVEEVQVDFECLKRAYSERIKVEEEPEETRWQTALQKFHTAQELGMNYRNFDGKMMVPGLIAASAVQTVMETLERLNTAKDEVEELHRDYQTHMNKLQEDRKYCMKYRERLLKTMSDLQSVSELLDSCTIMDLGSEQLTSRLTLQFTHATPHFTQLDAEADFITANFETVRSLRDRHSLKGSETVTDEDVSALLGLHLHLKQKIEESRSILELSSNLHLLNKQLEELLQSKPGTQGQTGYVDEKINLLKEQKERIHNLFNRASNLKMDICKGIRNGSVLGFQVEQLESGLQSLDTCRAAWMSEAAQCEEDLLREKKTEALLKDIHQLQDSFKDLKKRFGNLKFNYLKRNDRSRNIKAARNQLQQVELYEDKLQSLVNRLQSLTGRMHSELKEGRGPRELEDLLNQLNRQMGECERSVREHHKTLDMTCTLQEAMDEYQFWCEEASGTISRVGKFSSECSTSEAVSALYRQFEKFVWPTVPQQEERISQITELATRLHGVEEGRRYIEKTVSKHSAMVNAIRKLSDGLLELEAKLKLESLKQQQKEEEEVMKEDKHVVGIKKKDIEVNLIKTEDHVKSSSEDQVDNRAVQEAAEMYELKETGHTPELTNKHDGKEISVRRYSFNKKPPLQKNRTQETDRQATSSFCSTHTFSLSCSPLESNRQVHAIINQSKPAIPIQVPASPSETKREEKNIAADSPLDIEPLHPHPDALSEDSLSTDEYECPSPDDISLPPLAETPESILVPSDLEEGLCFSSQHSYRSHAQSDNRESRESNLHSVNRARTESGTFVPSPVTIPIPTQVQTEFTATVCSTINEESTVTSAQGSQIVSNNIPAQPPRNVEPFLLVHTVKNKNPSQKIFFTTPSIQRSEDISSLPKSFPLCQSSIHQEISLEVTKHSNANILEKSQSDQVVEKIAAEPKFEIPGSGVPSINEATAISNSHLLHNQILEHSLDSYNVKSSTNRRNTKTASYQVSSECPHKPNSNKITAEVSTVTKETVYSQSSLTSTSLVQDVITPTSEENTSTKSSPQQKIEEDLKSTMLSDHEPSVDYNDELISKHFKFSPESFVKNVTDPPQNLIASSAKGSDNINNLNPSSDTTPNTKESHQTSTQQCVHDSGFSAQLGAAVLFEPKTQALAQLANPHVTPFTSHQLLLTPDQDPDICQPCTIREEIRLTPQIKGPSIPPHAQDEGSCFTRPMSEATIMGGSPVTLEVEVTGQPEPTLTWCKDHTEEEELTIAANQSCEEGRALDGALCEAWLRAGAKLHKNITEYADEDERDDRGVMAEVYDIIMADWQTWFGTLCFLLWLLFLIVV